MLIVSVKSSKLDWVNSLDELNTIPVVGPLILACCFMFPTLILQYFVELLVGDIPLYDLSFVFFLNTFCIHLFLRILFDIRINFFFISSLVLSLICMVINFFRDRAELMEFLFEQ